MTHQLYNEQLKQHNRHPVGWTEQLSADYLSTQENHFCGDEISVGVNLFTMPDGAAENIVSLAFSGECCAICRASASLMCQSLEKKTLTEVKAFISQFNDALQNHANFPSELSALSLIKQYPVRAQCARLPWQALQQILTSFSSDSLPPESQLRQGVGHV